MKAVLPTGNSPSAAMLDVAANGTLNVERGAVAAASFLSLLLSGSLQVPAQQKSWLDDKAELSWSRCGGGILAVDFAVRTRPKAGEWNGSAESGKRELVSASRSVSVWQKLLLFATAIVNARSSLRSARSSKRWGMTGGEQANGSSRGTGPEKKADRE